MKKIRKMQDFFIVNNNVDADSLSNGEEDNKDLELVKFYGYLLFEKLARQKNIGKFKFEDEIEVSRMGLTDIYEIEITIDHEFKSCDIDFIKNCLEEVKAIYDENNNVSVTQNNFLRVNIKIDIEKIRSLEPAAETITKFKL